MAVETGPKPETLNGGSSQPQEQPKSLREVAEAAYDEVESGADADEGDDGSDQQDDGGKVDSAGRRHDARGRFAPKGEEPGGAEDGEPPSPDDEQQVAPDGAKPEEPAPGSTQPPQHWSEQDREMFARLPQEGQAFLLRRHTEMERDYTAKAQANATAVQFTDAVGQLFQDPVIAESQRRSGLDPYQMIHALMSMQRRGMNPDPRERMNLLVDVARNIGLDPATIFATSQSGQPSSAPELSEAEKANPAIKYFADHLGRTSTEVNQLRSTVQQLVQGNQQAAQEQQMRVTKWGIDSFADEKDERGQPLHPHFDAVLPQIIELFKANPQRDLREAYQTALWMAPHTRQAQLEAAERQRQAKAANARAAQANRSNVRGQTTRVTGKPPADTDKPRSLRDTIAETADEIGF